VAYGQDALLASELWITEGQNDKLSLHDAGEEHVVATLGGYFAPELTAWLAQNAGGKRFLLAFDKDQAGQKYAMHYSAVIQHAGGIALFIRW